MDDRSPYTYLIGWSEHNTWYYGVRYALKCKPTDLWVTYFTSSKYVQEFRKKYGEPNVVTIRKTFDSADKARLYEHKVLIRLKASLNPKFLNRSYVMACSPEKHHMKTKFHRKRQSMMTSGEKNPMYGKIQSGESNHKRSIAQVGKPSLSNGKTLEEMYGKEIALQIKLKQSKSLSGEANPMFGKTQSSETRSLISQNRIGKYSGSSNGNAKSIVINNIEYSCIKDAVSILNVSRYKISKLLENNNE